MFRSVSTRLTTCPNTGRASYGYLLSLSKKARQGEATVFVYVLFQILTYERHNEPEEPYNDEPTN